MSQVIYLDHSATTKAHPQVVEAMSQCFFTNYGNPSSLHRIGLTAERAVNKSRKDIGSIMGCQPKELIFTSGGSESNNLAILGVTEKYANKGKHVITTRIEHASVLGPCEYLKQKGFQVTYLDVDSWGSIDLQQLADSITAETILISIMMVNNELGSVQPIEKISQLVKEKASNAFLHVDGVQAIGISKIDLRELGVDLFSFSGHKFYGPKGIGGLYVRQGVQLMPMIHGGGQENGLRSGTENLPGIVGMAKALTLVSANREIETDRMRKLQQQLWQGISAELPSAILNSDLEKGAPHIVSISFPGVKGEVLLHYLESEGIYVSTGSACSSKSRNISHVLSAIGLNQREADGTIRFSFGIENTKEDINYTIRKTVLGVKDLINIIGR